LSSLIPSNRDDQGDDDEDDARQTKGVIGIGLIALMILAGVMLAQHLRTESAIEDCLLASHHNCDDLVTGPQQQQD
jgi:hypothetical protein